MNKNPDRDSVDQIRALIHLLTMASRLSLKAFRARSHEALIFTILNDTMAVGRYDRATLWDVSTRKPTLQGISGQPKLPANPPLLESWREQLSQLGDLNKCQQGEVKAAKESKTQAKLYWFPIPCEGVQNIGVAFEIWKERPRNLDHNLKAVQKTFSESLMPAYGASWERIQQRFSMKSFALDRRYVLGGLAVVLLALVLIRVPLRVIAPCEIVPKDPVVVTTPVEGVVDRVLVKPGQEVSFDEPLFAYRKEEPMQRYYVAEKEVKVLRSELNRVATLGLDDQEMRKKYGVFKNRLERGEAELALAKYQISHVVVKAPVDGVVVIKQPDEWRGKPVQIGDPVLQLHDPSRTKVRIWIPESDNIDLDPTRTAKVIFNVAPTTSYPVDISWIANQSALSDLQVTSFVAEGSWAGDPNDLKLGLKGSAFLYGERVSLAYFIFRKPWGYLRYLTGM